jgi:hypothetical protein
MVAVKEMGELTMLGLFFMLTCSVARPTPKFVVFEGGLK